jgi:threonylcarbamoyladenosine tRNA methylthiotransferase MtaB
MVLKRMKRRHLRSDAVGTVARLKAKRPEIAIGADLIAGFPTETEAMHENSLRLIDECDIVMAHIFPFSPKRGTPAARMPRVEPELVKARARRLREASARRKAAWLEGLVGTRQEVLVEKNGFGHAENFAPVRVSPPDRHPRESEGPSRRCDSLGVGLDPSLRCDDDGKIIAVTITAVEGGHLIGVTA